MAQHKGGPASAVIKQTNICLIQPLNLSPPAAASPTTDKKRFKSCWILSRNQNEKYPICLRCEVPNTAHSRDGSHTFESKRQYLGHLSCRNVAIVGCALSSYFSIWWLVKVSQQRRTKGRRRRCKPRGRVGA
ncbi:predicted protein [Histoplasma capsulatum G186AR]|uniref:Uncharacterized protein n=1 Tax=Ajellomyces capsulatus (strain G186AR / H82 / ATCC MYA-2454 / RMSCC 2432) TaxID=447093 RepID=C0NT57_AJECG|nr:uncharacterized protein HCBG_06337 [Histoplasma capsulatum G186AR]EEH05218.1 predicted protein [Histoplasma capsulatum G186AR]